jgi:hypothetical protein
MWGCLNDIDVCALKAVKMGRVIVAIVSLSDLVIN